MSRRSGKKDYGNRIIIVTLRHQEDAKFIHKFNFGRKIENGEENRRINSDLTRTKRKSAFEKRKKRKKNNKNFKKSQIEN